MSDFYYDLEYLKKVVHCMSKNMYEVLVSDTDLSGLSVNKNYKLGVNITTGKLFYVDIEGEWQEVPGGSGGGNITQADIDNWNLAYSWGDHSSQGYLKDFPANSIAVNNTNITAPPTYPEYYEVLNQPLSSVGFTFTGSTAPSGAENHNYSWWKIGNKVTVLIHIYYENAGTITHVNIPFPSDLPLPFVKPGFNVANAILYSGAGRMALNSTTVLNPTSSASYIKRDAADTGYEIVILETSGPRRLIMGEITYQSI